MAPATPSADVIVHFPAPGTGWASQVVRACVAGYLPVQTMWDLLFAHADRDDDGPDVPNLLANLRDAYEQRTLVLEQELSAVEDEIVVMSGDDDGVMVAGGDYRTPVASR
ncbi:MAG: hypothetical protein H0V44_09375 [Planctomycetes bacterium]|nr:hypothetical protein [Planctomycetota bacterium]